MVKNLAGLGTLVTRVSMKNINGSHALDCVAVTRYCGPDGNTPVTVYRTSTEQRPYSDSLCMSFFQCGGIKNINISVF